MTTKEIIEKICKDNNLTQRQLADVTGLTEQYLYDANYGKFKKITQKNAQKITAVFPQYPLMWLMTGNETFLNQRGTTINIDNSNTGHHNNIGNGTQTNNGGDAEMWKKIIAEKDAQIAELKADKERLYQLLLKQ